MTEPIAERPQMRDYGVPTEPEGLLPWSWARDRLVTSRNYWVITADPDARPHAMPVWGVWLDTGPFVFSCSPNSRKARNLAANPQMVAAVDSTVEVVSVEGIAHPVSGPAAEPAIGAYVLKYGVEVEESLRAGLTDFLRRHAIFAMRPLRAFAVIERPDEFATRATRWRWPDLP